MNTRQFTLYGSSQKPIQLRAERIALHLGAGIIEARGKHDIYYLFFYKQDFLTAAKAKQLRRRSFIESAFKHGMVFNAPHPFIDVLLSTNAPCRISRLDPLLNKLDKRYTPQEKAFILTFFESFISKKRLFNEIKSIFYVYRRNGQSLMAYQIVRILMDFAPNHDMVRQLQSDMNFKQYADMYSKRSETILAKDIIFTEKVLYAGMDNDNDFERLLTLLDEQDRWIEIIALYVNKLAESPSDKYYNAFIKRLDKHFNQQDVTRILEKLHHQLPRYAPLKQDLLKYYTGQNQLENVLTMFADSDINPGAPQIESIKTMIEQADLESRSLTSDQLQSLIQMTIDVYPEKAGDLVHGYMSSLLKSYEPAFLKELLQPFTDNRKVHPVYQKIDRLITFSDDLDQMLPLGELYYEFNQPDQAIECFSWVMELSPEDPAPLKWLSRVYQELGLKQESKAYRQLLSDLQKRA